MANTGGKKPLYAIGTRTVGAGEPTQYAYSAVVSPIACTATYTFSKTEEIHAHFQGKIEREEYGRYGNPTVKVAERKIAELDSAEGCALFASGMAAVTTTLLAMLRSGQHLVITSDCYRRTRQFVAEVLPRFGIQHTLVEPGDYAGLESAIRPGSTRLILAESPSNPYLRVVDLPRLAAIRDRHRPVKILIDSTFATPINQRPHELGMDLVLHSATKYLGGHNDLLAGSVSGKSGLIQAITDFRGVLGGILDPHSAYLLIRGMKTLDLRVRRQNENALEVARFLESHPEVERVHYPGLESHPDHAVALAQMSGFGGVVSFELKGDLLRGSRFVDRLQIPRLAPSLGGVESLIEQPALMSFYELSTEERAKIGIRDSLVRFSVGIEDPKDLIDDLAAALSGASLTGSH